MEDHSVCALHPGVAVTGFCPACLRDRLAGLHPPSGDLRRCKSFSYYARSSSAVCLDPHRRSCDVRQPPPPPPPLVPEDIMGRPMKDHITQERAAGAFGSLGKRWHEWRRKSKLKKQGGPPTRPAVPPPPPPPESDLARRSCDVYAFSGRINQLLGVDEPRASWDGLGYHGDRPAPMLFVPRSDGQIPVEEEEDEDDLAGQYAVPGGTAQTREYYLDSSSSSRRRRSLDRKSFSDASELPPPRMVVAAGAAANARVSPAVVAELYHHHQQQQQQHLTGHGHAHHEEEAAFREAKSKGKKGGIKGWSIWGLLQKKSQSSNSISTSSSIPASSAFRPELRARGYDGQMLRCNSSVSARSSFSLSGRNGGRTRREEAMLLDRNLSARYSSPCKQASSRPPRSSYSISSSSFLAEY